MTLELAKGTQDISGEEEILKQELLAKLRTSFELYGFNPLNTTILERLDSLTSKYSGGDEIVKEIFKLKDQGDRDLGLRFDLTVPFSRFVGMNKDLKMPFKRYEMGVVFRDGPIKLGRYREFWQCDADMVGCPSQTAEIEVLNLAKDFFKSINLNIITKINDIRILKGIMQASNIRDEELQGKAILVIDKLAKIGINEVKKELSELNLSDIQIERLTKIISIQDTNQNKIKELEKYVNDIPANKELEEGLNNIKQILTLSNNKENQEAIEFDPSLSRGLSYYTATIYEVFLKDSQIKSSILGGGRYDKMIGNFLGTTQPYPAVGISFGLSVIIDALRLKQEKNQTLKKTVSKVYIIPINTQQECFKLAEQLRNNNINTELDLNSKSISKNLDYANYYKIPYVIIIGEDEIKKGQFKLKDMLQGKEEFLSEKELIAKLQK